MSKVVLTKEEKDCLKHLVYNRGLTDYAFLKAAELAKNADKALIDKVRELWPHAMGIEHPVHGKWIVTLCDKKKEALPKKTKKE